MKTGEFPTGDAVENPVGSMALVFSQIRGGGIQVRITKKWSKTEEDYIRENYTELLDEEIAEALNRTMRSVRMKRQRLGLFRYFQEPAPPIKGEIWKAIGGKYEVSNKGRLRKDGFKHLRPHVHKTGYVYICIAGERKLIHRLVIEAFQGRIPEGYETNHKDGNKLNNSLYNLEVVTHSENMSHAYHSGLFKNFFGK